MSLSSVSLFDWVEYHGDLFQVVEVDGPLLSLKPHSGGKPLALDVAELIADGSPPPDTSASVLGDVSVLETLPAEERERVMFLHRHVHEVLTGVPFVYEDEDVEPRKEYAATRPVLERVGTKVAELKGLGRPVGRRSLQRYMSAYQQEGVAGLVDGRKVRATRPEGRVDPRLATIVSQRVKAETDRSTGYRNRLITEALAEYKQLDDAQVPSTATMYRLLSALEGGSHAFGNATTRRSLANRPDRQFGSQNPVRPGQLVEVDSTPLNIMALMPDGSTGKVDLTAMIDVATRTPLALIVRPTAAKGVDAALLLAKAVTPLREIPDWDDLVDMARRLLPPGMVAPDQTVKAAAARKPVIVPESITVDRGKIYVGTTFLNACNHLGISVVKAAPRTPTDKGHIERYLGSSITSFIQYLAGYTGINVVQRGKNPASQAIWTVPDLQILLDLWFLLHWQDRPHPALKHPAMPKRALSPNEMYAALAGVAPQVRVKLTRDDFINMLNVTHRRVQPYGVNFEGLTYQDKGGKIARLAGRPSGLPAPNANRYEVRYDPYRLDAIWVRDAHAGEWIQAHWQLSALLTAPFSQDMLKVAKRALKKSKTPLAQSDILAQLNRIQEDAATTKEKRAANRNKTVKGAVPIAVDIEEGGDMTEEDLAADAGSKQGSRAASGKNSMPDRIKPAEPVKNMFE